jgi:hypothetical protein
LKLKSYFSFSIRAFLLMAVICAGISAGPAQAQMFSSLLGGSSSWWDWSDYRANVGYRIFLPRVSGKVEARGETHDFADFGIRDDQEFFKALYFEWYIDRLGIRIDVEEDHKFQGHSSDATYPAKISELDISGNRLGLDLDIIRYPFVRAGIDFTYFTNQVTFQDRRHETDPTLWMQYSGSQPLQIGVHGRLIAARIRNVPFTIQGKFRGPIPLVQRPTEAKITEWEISGGLRPAIWETSLLGHSTFSFSIEAGYRACYLTLHARPQRLLDLSDDTEANVTARWGGAFIQATFVY